MAGKFSCIGNWPMKLLMALLLMPAWAMAQPAVQPQAMLFDQPVLISAKAPHVVLLSLARAGERLVAAGARGVILLSDDQGGHWRQARVPASVSITSVFFIDAEYGWAVGHLGVVLHSRDGGESWSKQLDGVQAAQLALSSAKQLGDERLLKSAQWLVADGPDKPLLDVYFADRRNGFVVGAYGLALRTQDGGASWQPWMQHVDNPDGLNLYAIRALGSDIFIAGERGLLLRASDQGQHFARLQSPYDGSFFGLLSSRDGALVAFGLRGNAWFSADRGNTWRQLLIQTESALSSATELQDGRLLLASQSGELWIADAAGHDVQHRRTEQGATVAAVIQANNGHLISVGLGGVSAPLEIQAQARP